MATTIRFDRNTIAAWDRLSSRLIRDGAELSVGLCDDDFIRELFTAVMKANVYERISEERDLVYYCDRPKFSDWLFRRRKKAVFNLKVKDLLLDPPPSVDSLRIYVTEKQ